MTAEVETTTMHKSLCDWKLYFSSYIEEARCAVMSESDRDELIKFVKREAEFIFYAPWTPKTEQEIDPYEAPWADIGYQRGAIR